MAVPAYVLTEMTWPEAKEAFQTATLAIVPIGAQEQHGPHLKMSCDAVLATEMARRLAERLYPHAVVTPTVNMGVSPHHLNFPGTITLHPETLIRLLRDIVRSLHRHGLRRFLFLNAHGGNQATLQVAATALAEELDVRLYIPPLAYCMDNAAMIAITGYFKARAGLESPLTLAAVPALTV